MENNCKTLDEFIGVQLQILRLKQNLKRIDLANLLNVTTEQIRKYELGKNRLTAKALYIISYNYNVDMSFFFENLNKTKILNKKQDLQDQPVSRLKKLLNIH